MRYPERAGFKEGTTSRQAADRIEAKGRAAALRAAVYGAYASGWEGTADELAAKLHADVLSIRPRVSELYTQGWLERTGQRRKNASGNTAHVMRLRSDLRGVA